MSVKCFASTVLVLEQLNSKKSRHISFLLYLLFVVPPQQTNKEGNKPRYGDFIYFKPLHNLVYGKRELVSNEK